VENKFLVGRNLELFPEIAIGGELIVIHGCYVAQVELFQCPYHDLPVLIGNGLREALEDFPEVGEGSA
jgi:hypothetical protein